MINKKTLNKIHGEDLLRGFCYFADFPLKRVVFIAWLGEFGKELSANPCNQNTCEKLNFSQVDST